MKLAFVADQALQASGGGTYAVTWHAFHQLARHFTVAYAGPILPRVPRLANYGSKVRRKILKVPGRFAFFSPATLARTAARVARLVPADADAVLFRSAAPWCRSTPGVPYFVYLDCVFHTFFHNTFRPGDFVRADLERIWAEEARFIEGAAGVFFESQWGLDLAREAYGLQGTHYHAVGRGGVMDPPAADTWQGGARVVTMAKNFRQKGGHIVYEAFRRLKPRYPALQWHILGGPPDFDWRQVEGVHYEGMLNPADAADLDRMRALLAGAFLLLHPTLEDVNPLVPTEAAYFGTPTISVRRFAIPELVLDERTGLLIDFPPAPDALAEAMARLLDDPARYRAMRTAARRFAVTHFSWDQIGDTMAGLIGQGIRRGRREAAACAPPRT